MKINPLQAAMAGPLIEPDWQERANKFEIALRRINKLECTCDDAFLYRGAEDHSCARHEAYRALKAAGITVD